jgi:hypothetical protein
MISAGKLIPDSGVLRHRDVIQLFVGLNESAASAAPSLQAIPTQISFEILTEFVSNGKVSGHNGKRLSYCSSVAWFGDRVIEELIRTGTVAGKVVSTNRTEEQ